MLSRFGSSVIIKSQQGDPLRLWGKPLPYLLLQSSEPTLSSEAKVLVQQLGNAFLEMYATVALKVAEHILKI